ncbi:ABC transporter permease, partial [Flavitalea flava]
WLTIRTTSLVQDFHLRANEHAWRTKEGVKGPREALGKYIYLGNSKGPIVGVVRDFHEHSLRDPIDPAAISTQKSSYRMAGIKLSGRNMGTILAAIEKIFNGHFPETLFQHQFLNETIARFYEEEEKLSMIFKVFAAIAHTISCLGLYGLILFTTSHRVKEVGVRKVLGASLANISFLFIREFLWLIGISFVIASPLAWYIMQKWLQNFTYRVSLSVWMFVATGLTALSIGLLTIGFQTIKAALANPVKALQSE